MNYDNETLRKITLLISKTEGIGPSTFMQLLSRYSDIDNLAKLYVNKSVKEIKRHKDLRDYDTININLNKNEIKYKCIWEDEYPSNLKNINDPPIILYYKGTWDSKKINNSLTIVGTRVPSKSGMQIAYDLACDLSMKGFSIVSGLALGIDKQAHNGCLFNKGYTIAVLAGSPHESLPKSNELVYKKILDEGGIIISEFSPEIKVVPGMFANRNRIVAGISLGTIVVEAGEKSGALITANLALNYNREVFAVPGSIYSSKSAGTNLLIRDSKAKLIMDINDILVEFDHLKLDNKKIKFNINELGKVEKEVYYAILTEPKTAEEISLTMNKDIKDIIPVCSIMEIKGILVRDLLNKFYIN